jgi:hypothetical protein
MTPEQVAVCCTDGYTFSFLLHAEPDGLHIDTGYLGKFIIRPDSAYQVCQRILLLISAGRPLAELAAWELKSEK